jgi:hypothetical protein
MERAPRIEAHLATWSRTVSSSFSLQIDPTDVLGVRRDAPLQEVRDAYRAKAKRYHPDAGGEEWVFRTLVQAYEILSTARVAEASHRESDRPSASARGPTGPSRSRTHSEPPPPRTGPSMGPADESLRKGVQDPAVDRTRVVEVEKLSIRYQSEGIWLITDRSNEQRFLSCSLNLNWPDPELTTPPSQIEGGEKILQDLGEVFDALCVQSQATTSRSAVLDGRFTAWLSYPSNDRASAAFTLLREMLHAVGLVVNQWSRDIVLPRHRH